MAGFLLDTNVVSELRRREPDAKVLAWLATTSSADLHLSVLTVGEIHQGIERLRRRDQRQASMLTEWVDTLVTEYADRILPVSVEVARRWAELNVVRTLPVIDSLIAATAAVHGLTVATRNTRGMDGVGVELLDPWL